MLFFLIHRRGHWQGVTTVLDYGNEGTMRTGSLMAGSMAVYIINLALQKRVNRCAITSTSKAQKSIEEACNLSANGLTGYGLKLDSEEGAYRHA